MEYCSTINRNGIHAVAWVSLKCIMLRERNQTRKTISGHYGKSKNYRDRKQISCQESEVAVRCDSKGALRRNLGRQKCSTPLVWWRWLQNSFICQNPSNRTLRRVNLTTCRLHHGKPDWKWTSKPDRVEEGIWFLRFGVGASFHPNNLSKLFMFWLFKMKDDCNILLPSYNNSNKPLYSQLAKSTNIISVDWMCLGVKLTFCRNVKGTDLMWFRMATPAFGLCSLISFQTYLFQHWAMKYLLGTNRNLILFYKKVQVLSFFL